MTLSTIERSSVTVRGRTTSASREEQISAIAFDTALDWMALAWRENALLGVAFGYPSQRQAKFALGRGLYLPGQFWHFPTAGQLASEPKWLADLMAGLQRFAEGEPVDFCSVPLALDHLSRFGRRVVAACRAIPWGQVTTYGDLAAACGSPGAARAVGSVMARNRYPLIVPCHRVLASGGGLGGYSAPDGLRMKRRLLAMERGDGS
jgi:methylated-DNA-[protein]-cysteine S-methyltransferase